MSNTIAFVLWNSPLEAAIKELYKLMRLWTGRSYEELILI